MRRLRPALLSTMLLTGVAPAAPTPEATVNNFLSFYFGKYSFGIPGKELLAEMKPFLTPALYDGFDRAAASEACHFAKVGNSEPPLVEGDVFSSMFEGAKSATIAPAAISGDQAVVTIHWTYDDPTDDSPATRWDDRAFLERLDGDWRIADFAHDGDWQFMSKQRVSVTLAEVAAACR